MQKPNKLYVFDKDFLVPSPKTNPWGINFIEDEFAKTVLSKIDDRKELALTVAKASGYTALIYQDLVKPLIKRVDQVESKAVYLIEKFKLDFLCVAIAHNEALLLEGSWQTYKIDAKQAKLLTNRLNPPGLGLVEIILKKYNLPHATVYAEKSKYIKDTNSNQKIFQIITP